MKPFKLSKEEIKSLIPTMGGCLASDRILVDGCEVGYMYRQDPTDSVSSGWTFLAGDEDEDYLNDPDHLAIYEVNTICNYDPGIIPYLDSPMGAAWAKDPDTQQFEEEPMPQDDEPEE